MESPLFRKSCNKIQKYFVEVFEKLEEKEDKLTQLILNSLSSIETEDNFYKVSSFLNIVEKLFEILHTYGHEKHDPRIQKVKRIFLFEKTNENMPLKIKTKILEPIEYKYKEQRLEIINKSVMFTEYLKEPKIAYYSDFEETFDVAPIEYGL